MDKKLIEKINGITESEWDMLVLNLTRYTIYEMDRKTWMHRRIPNGLTPEDLALEAIADFLDRKRTWNYEKQPNLLYFLKSVVDSKISHLFELDDYKRTQPFPMTEEGQEVEEMLDKANPAADHACYSPIKSLNPEEILLKKEEKQGDEAVVRMLIDLIAGDKELETLFDLICDGLKPAEIAAKMRINVKEVYNLKKRLDRKCRELRATIKSKENL